MIESEGARVYEVCVSTKHNVPPFLESVYGSMYGTVNAHAIGGPWVFMSVLGEDAEFVEHWLNENDLVVMYNEAKPTAK